LSTEGDPPECATYVHPDSLNDAVGGFSTANQTKTLQVLPGGGQEVDHEIANFPGALNIIGRMAHEEAFVRLFGPQRLIDREVSGDEPPHVGFLSAYDPFTGADCCPADLASTGQLYQFEATGALGRWTSFTPPDNHGRDVYGAGLFNWAPVQNNQMRLRRGDRMTFHPSRAPRSRMVRMFCIRIDENEHPESYRHGQVYRPIVFKHPGNAARPMDSDEAVNTCYARRAIPFMTMAEFQALGLYDTLDQVNSKITRVITEFSNHVRDRLVTEEPPPPPAGHVESQQEQQNRNLIRRRRMLEPDYQEVAVRNGEKGNHKTFFEQLGFRLDPR
jgi:hypothetical protein